MSSSTVGEKVSGHLSICTRLCSLWLRTVVGTLKGYDQLMNLVLDDVQELLRGMNGSVFNNKVFIAKDSVQMTKAMNHRGRWA